MNHDPIPADTVFAKLTAASPLDDLCVAAHLAAARAARNDLALPDVAPVLASDEATLAYLRNPETRVLLEAWLTSYRHDAEVLAALSPQSRVVARDGDTRRVPRAEVLHSAWLAYETTVMQARDAARKAV
jgi:hypothetical protein